VGQSTEELTSQIEDTRQRMAADLDTLQDRVSPSAIVERRKQAVRGRFTSMKDKVMGTAHGVTGSVSSAASSTASTASETSSGLASATQERFEGAPLAAGLVAFGAGLVAASLLPASRVEAEAAHRVVDAAKEHGQPLLDDAKSAGQELADTVKRSAMDSAQQVKDSAQQSARVVSGEAQTSAETVRDQASS
jgi:gas vesicle protein